MTTFIIDPGHGGVELAGNSTPFGIVGPTGLREKDVTLDLAKRLSSRLGGNVALTRNADNNLSLAQRIAIANRGNAEVFLSVHADCRPSSARGAEVWVHNRAGPASMALAGALARQLRQLGGGADIHPGALSVLSPEHHARSTAACLVELDNLKNPAAERCLRDPAWLNAVATALAQGACEERVSYGQGTAALEESEDLWVTRLADAIPRDRDLERLETIHYVTEVIEALHVALEIVSVEALAAIALKIGGEALMDLMLTIGELAEGVLTFLAPAAAVLGELAVLALPYAQASQEIAQRYATKGFAYGVVFAVDGHQPKDILNEGSVWSPSFPDNPLVDDAQRIQLHAYQIGMLAGLKNGRELTFQQRKNFWSDLINRDQGRLVDWKSERMAPSDLFYADAAGLFIAAHLR
jgi:hypothetical protein